MRAAWARIQERVKRKDSASAGSMIGSRYSRTASGSSETLSLTKPSARSRS